MRVLGLDIGTKYIGMAITDETGSIAQPFASYTRQGLKKDLLFFDNFVKKHNIKKIIVGYPLNMDDTENEMSIFVKNFYNKIKKRWQIPVILWDERLTTEQAENALRESNKVKFIKRKELKDKVAASLILASYINGTDGNGS